MSKAASVWPCVIVSMDSRARGQEGREVWLSIPRLSAVTVFLVCSKGSELNSFAEGIWTLISSWPGSLCGFLLHSDLCWSFGLILSECDLRGGVWAFMAVPYVLVAASPGWKHCPDEKKYLGGWSRQESVTLWGKTLQETVVSMLVPWVLSPGICSSVSFIFFVLAQGVHIHPGLWSSVQENKQKVRDPWQIQKCYFKDEHHI